MAILRRNPSNRVVILLIAIISATGFGLFTNADMNVMFKVYGLIFTCQISFALFFLNQLRQKRTKVAEPLSESSRFKDP
jgi:hypothetical protein